MLGVMVKTVDKGRNMIDILRNKKRNEKKQIVYTGIEENRETVSPGQSNITKRENWPRYFFLLYCDIFSYQSGINNE